MKFSIKTLALFLVVFNTLMLIDELPKAVIASVFVSILFSFFITHKLLRNIFKIILLAGNLVLLRYLFKPLLVTEAGVSLVLILASLKLWELDSESDHFNMFLILALSEACLFLLSPTFPMFFLGICKIILFFYFILKIRNYDLSLLSGTRLLFLIIPSLLLSLVLFYTFPRFTQGFITASNNQLLFTGSDSNLNFKKLGPLTLSSKIVFRVYGIAPKNFPPPLLYWRESILWDYNNNEWKSGYLNLRSEQHPTPAPIVNYKVQLSKDTNEFLPTLDGISHVTKSSLDFQYFSEESFRLRNVSRSNVVYEVDTSYKENPHTLIPLMQRKGVRLKSSEKENVANLILQNKKPQTDLEKFNLAIDFFKKRNYEYSLTPPEYSSLENFIFNGKSGYCSHFSASFAYMARAIGLPTRIVSGYQGGEYNPYDHSIIVRELDAHAWVEVYLKNSGWVKFDPTAIVAPGRITQGALAYHEKIDPYINLYFYKISKSSLNFKALNQASLWLDSINTSFSTTILNFDKEKQQQILSSLLPKNLSVGWLFVIGLCGSLPLFWILFTFLTRQKISAKERRYQKFLKRMRREGIEKKSHETASQFAAHCIHALPDLKLIIEEETLHYINSFYRE